MPKIIPFLLSLTSVFCMIPTSSATVDEGAIVESLGENTKRLEAVNSLKVNPPKNALEVDSYLIEADMLGTLYLERMELLNAFTQIVGPQMVLPIRKSLLVSLANLGSYLCDVYEAARTMPEIQIAEDERLPSYMRICSSERVKTLLDEAHVAQDLETVRLIDECMRQFERATDIHVAASSARQKKRVESVQAKIDKVLAVLFMKKHGFGGHTKQILDDETLLNVFDQSALDLNTLFNHWLDLIKMKIGSSVSVAGARGVQTAETLTDIERRILRTSQLIQVVQARSTEHALRKQEALMQRVIVLGGTVLSGAVALIKGGLDWAVASAKPARRRQGDNHDRRGIDLGIRKAPAILPGFDAQAGGPQTDVQIVRFNEELLQKGIKVSLELQQQEHEAQQHAARESRQKEEQIKREEQERARRERELQKEQHQRAEAARREAFEDACWQKSGTKFTHGKRDNSFALFIAHKMTDADKTLTSDQLMNKYWKEYQEDKKAKSKRSKKRDGNNNNE